MSILLLTFYSNAYICITGSFYCNNVGHKGKNIASSYVNDGVCDCCDASDEYASSSDCIDTCENLGKAAKEEAKRVAEVQLQGFNIRQTMAEEGLRLKKEKQVCIIYPIIPTIYFL